MNRACSRSRLRNPLAFTPLNLFSTGEQGVWFDPSDMATLFQDDAGTVPVTAAGQVVGRVLDKSGNANHATQATAASKPILRNSGSLWWLEFDGVDDFLVTGSINFAATDAVSIFAGLRKLNDATTACFIETGTDSSTINGSFGSFAPGQAGVNKFDVRSRGTVAQNAITTDVAFNAPVTVVLTGQSDISDDLLTMRLNGAVAGINSGNQGNGNYASLPMYIGRRAGTTLPAQFNMYQLIIRGSLTGLASQSAAESFVATKTDITI